MVSHLRLASRLAASVASDDECLSAFEREIHYIHRSFRRLGTPPSEVEDLAQELFLAFRDSWSKYDPSRPLRPYLFAFAFRIAAAHHRKRKRELAMGVAEMTDQEPNPEESLRSKQARALVLVALDRIPLPRRAVLIMHELDDVPVSDVASLLAIPRFTAYSRLRKARRELHAAIERLGREGTDES